MHKFLSNFVNKFKNTNFQNLIIDKNSRNAFNSCGIHTGSLSNAKYQTSKGTTNQVVNFDELVTTRRAQAQRSILVQVNSEKSFPELQKYCCQYGSIVGAHHYKLTDKQYILLEYSSVEEAKQAIEDSVYNDTADSHRVRSPFLWFSAASKGTAINHKITGELLVTDGCKEIDYDEVYQIMLAAKNISDQMTILYKMTTLNDLGVRLRFLAARQVEESVTGIFPNAEACIFGSSVNGYGKIGCDLDLILHFNPIATEIDLTKRLVFQTKKTTKNGRAQVQRNLENLSDTMQMYLPGISQVIRILQARVPIVRYRQEQLNLEVDLSMNNMSGVYMSELLYTFTQIDERVAPLVCSVRRWARMTGVTNGSPGVWISNFSLTCLIIFYLQQLSQPVLPAINTLVEQARPQDRRPVQEGDVRSTFLRDLNVLKFTKQNTAPLDELLIGFFEFYSQMNFKERAISLNDARLHPKPDHSAVYIINPLEPLLNITKNISAEECERMRIEIKNAAWFMDSTDRKATGDSWGLVNLFRPGKKPIIRPTVFFKPRIMDVQYLFDDPHVNVDDADNEKPIKFKSAAVKDEVTKIKNQKAEFAKTQNMKTEVNKTVKTEVTKSQKKRRAQLNAMKSGGPKR